MRFVECCETVVFFDDLRAANGRHRECNERPMDVCVVGEALSRCGRGMVKVLGQSVRLVFNVRLLTLTLLQAQLGRKNLPRMWAELLWLLTVRCCNARFTLLCCCHSCSVRSLLTKKKNNGFISKTTNATITTLITITMTIMRKK